METEQEKQFLKKLYCAAIVFKEKMIGRTFLFVFNNMGIEVIFKRCNFPHLCGVNSPLHKDEFFRRCLSQTLKYNEITFKFDQNKRTANEKLDVISNISSIVSQDTFALENITTNSSGYKFGITDCKITICLCNDTDKNGNTLPIYVVKSLRAGDSFKKSQTQFIVDAVLSRPNTTKIYDKVNFKDKNFDLRNIPTQYLINVSQSLLKD